MSQPKLPSFAQFAAQFQSVRVSTLLWRCAAKENARGLAPIMLRITVDGERIERSCGHRIAAKDWDAESGEIRGKSRLVQLRNEELQLMKAHVRELVNLMKATGRKVTAITLRRQLAAPSVGQPLCFIELCQQQIAGFYESGNQGTLSHKRVCLSVLADWNGRNAAGAPLPLLVEDFTPDRAAQFYHWLLTTRQMKVNSANSLVSGLATLFGYAVKMGTVEVWENPFRLLKKKNREVSPRTRLSVEELAALREVELSGDAALARDIYLAQYYLHGSRVGAVLLLRWQNVADGRVNFKAEKSGPYKSVTIAPELLRVLARYRPATPQPAGLIFPALPAGFHDLDAAAQFKARHRAITCLNRGLQLAAAAVGITGRLHTHTARHTLALHAADTCGLGVAQAMLGHTDQKQTEQYVGQLRRDVLEAAEQQLYGASAPTPTPAPDSEGGRVVPMYRAA
jgi:integrase/recombinase XerD